MKFSFIYVSSVRKQNNDHATKQGDTEIEKCLDGMSITDLPGQKQNFPQKFQIIIITKYITKKGGFDKKIIENLIYLNYSDLLIG